MKIQAVVAGHLCLDILPDFGKAPTAEPAAILRPGGLREVGPAALATGGAVSNTGLALHKLGIPVRLIGKVGDDDFGGIVRRIISGYGRRMAGGIIVDRSSATSYSVIISRPGLDRIFLHHPGANDAFRASDVPVEWLSEARLFHFGYPPVMKSMFARNGPELAALFRKAKKAGATTSLDMSLPDPDSASGRADWPAILRRCCPGWTYSSRASRRSFSCCGEKRLTEFGSARAERASGFRPAPRCYRTSAVKSSKWAPKSSF